MWSENRSTLSAAEEDLWSIWDDHETEKCDWVRLLETSRKYSHRLLRSYCCAFIAGRPEMSDRFSTLAIPDIKHHIIINKLPACLCPTPTPTPLPSSIPNKCRVLLSSGMLLFQTSPLCVHTLAWLRRGSEQDRLIDQSMTGSISSPVWSHVLFHLVCLWRISSTLVLHLVASLVILGSNLVRIENPKEVHSREESSHCWICMCDRTSRRHPQLWRMCGRTIPVASAARRTN